MVINIIKIFPRSASIKKYHSSWEFEVNHLQNLQTAGKHFVV